MKKRILIDVNSVVPYYSLGIQSGIGRTTMELLNAIAQAPELPFEIMLYSQNLRGIGGKNLSLPFKNRHIYLRHTPYWDNFVKKYSIREWTTNYDLMHIPHNYEIVRYPERCIITLHDAIFMKQADSGFGFQHLRQIIPPFARQCCHIVTCSESSKADIIETMNVPENKVSVVYWGIQHDVFYPQSEKSAIREELKKKYGIFNSYFLSVSCDGERKRADVLVRSFIQFQKRHNTSFDLVLVWRDPPVSIIHEVAKEHLENRIHFLQGLSDSDLASLYNGATALFFPSSYEGFGLPILEAMACGVPVVTCRNSSLYEIGGVVPYYLEEPLEDSLIQMMLLFQTSPSDLLIRIESGIKRASSFTWEKAAKQMIQIYRELLQV